MTTLARSILRVLPALTGCSSPSSPGAPDQPSNPAPDAGRPDAADDLAARIAAARTTAATDPECTELGDFYWEIGDADGEIAGGAIGTRFDAATRIDIASASKLIWGAYVVERFRSDLSAIDMAAMTMRIGYVSMTYASCVATLTVTGCFHDGDNDRHTPADDGRFHYGGGHFQKYAVDLGLGSDSKAALADDVGALLGADLAIEYSSPQTAAGVNMAPEGYARFLRKILTRELAIGDHLGENAVCTLPAECPDAVYSPVPEPWLYSYGHWVETDGAFSSPGYFGFYPWIDAARIHYGIVARHDTSPEAYFESVECGRRIRQAFVTGAVP